MVSLLVLMPTLVSALSSSQTITRRGAVSAAAAIFGSRASSSRAATPATIIATGIVKNDPNCMGLTCSGLTPVPSNGALYISLRPSKNDAAVRPMATARFAGPITFPYMGFLSADLTPEYSGMDATAQPRTCALTSRSLSDSMMTVFFQPTDQMVSSVAARFGSAGLVSQNVGARHRPIARSRLRRPHLDVRQVSAVQPEASGHVAPMVISAERPRESLL